MRCRIVASSARYPILRDRSLWAGVRDSLLACRHAPASITAAFSHFWMGRKTRLLTSDAMLDEPPHPPVVDSVAEISSDRQAHPADHVSDLRYSRRMLARSMIVAICAALKAGIVWARMFPADSSSSRAATPVSSSGNSTTWTMFALADGPQQLADRAAGALDNLGEILCAPRSVTEALDALLGPIDEKHISRHVIP